MLSYPNALEKERVNIVNKYEMRQKAPSLTETISSIIGKIFYLPICLFRGQITALKYNI